MKSIFLQRQNLLKKSEKKSQHTSMLYMQRQKFATSNSTYIWRDKKDKSECE
jgi:hypothetical protein